MSNQLPTILLAFANDKQGNAFLRNIAKEQNAVSKALRKLEKEQLYNVIELADASADDIFDIFRTEEVRLFHYGGHADQGYLHLSSQKGEERNLNATHFTQYLGGQASLQLVFLNGCATYEQGQLLQKTSISYSIVTNRDINDEAALSFATHFYQNLATGASIPDAFNHASSMVLSTRQGNTRSLLWDREEPPVEDFAWEIFTGIKPDEKWTLLQKDDDRLIKEIKELIAKGKAKKGLEKLKSHMDDTQHENLDGAISLLSRLKKLDKDVMLGMIDYSSEVMQRAQITHAILQLTDSLQEKA